MGVTESITVVFTDMEGSTETSSAHGDEQAMRLLRVHESIAATAATEHGGRLIKSTGDGYLLAFSSSDAAVAAALEMRTALAAHNAAHPDERVLVRMGINSGPVIEERGDLYGLAVNAGARVAGKARTGQVLVSQAVRDELATSQSQWTFIDRGLFWLKGLREQWRLFEATDGSVALPAAVPNLGAALPFVDRDTERALLRRLVDEANGGAGRLVFVHGAAGAGKTRLVEEIGAEAVGRGLQFVAGRCFETASTNPYAPFVDVLAQLVRAHGDDDVRVLLGEGAANVAALLPEVRERIPEIPASPDWPVQEARSALFLSLRDMLARAGAARPLIVLIDDVHWADESTLHLLDYLAGEVADMPLLVVCTYSDDDIGPAVPLHTLLSALHRRRAASTVSVDALDVEHVRTLLQLVGPSEPPPSIVALLHEATGGNAFFLEEVTRHLSDRGRLFDASGAWQTATVVDDEVPDSVRYTVSQRLDALSPTTRGVLTVAAVAGREVEFDLLEELAEVDEDTLLDALDEGERMRLIVAKTEGGLVKFLFAHGLIRRALADELSQTRRQRLHLRIADAIEKVFAGRPVDRAADISFHLEQAGRWADPKRTEDFLVAAGDRALKAAAFEDALRYFDRALVLCGDRDPSRRASLLERLAVAERSLGHLDDALALWNEALSVFDALGSNDDVARLCLDAAIQVAWWRRGREVIELVERGLAALGETDSPLRGGLLALAGGVASQQGSYEQASRLLDDALAIARRHDDEGILGLALYTLAVHHFSYLHYPNVISAARAAVDHLRRAGDSWNLANAQGYLGASLGWVGEFEEADAVGAETEAFARRLGNWSAFVFADGARAFKAIGAAPAADVLEARGREAEELADRFDFNWLASIGHTRIGLADFWRGRWEDALARFEQAAAAEPRNASGGHHARLFLIHAYLGNRDVALRLMDEARPTFPVVGRPNSGTSWTVALSAVEALWLLDEDDAVAALYPTVIDHGSTGSLMRSWDYRLVATLAGVAASAMREWELADAHFAEARRLATSLPMRHEEPDVLRFQAMSLRKRGDIGGGGTLLDEAAGLYESFGMIRHAELTRRLRDAGDAGAT